MHETNLNLVSHKMLLMSACGRKVIVLSYFLHSICVIADILNGKYSMAAYDVDLISTSNAGLQ